MRLEGVLKVMKEVGDNEKKCEELKEVVLGAAEIVSGMKG